MNKDGKKQKKTTTPTQTEKDESKMAKIPPRDLKIAWGSDDTQWKIVDSDKEKECVAKAIKVTWLEVKATYKGARPGNKYQIGFKISLENDASGWDSSPVFMMAKVGESGYYTWKRLYFNISDAGKSATDFPSNFVISVPVSAKDTTLYFGLYEIWGGRWKTGLNIHHAFVTKT